MTFFRRLTGAKDSQPTCGSCRFFSEGACRRYPPARVYTGDISKTPGAMDVTVWPVVRPAQDWCGEHTS